MFDDDYLPEKVIGREKEIDEIAAAIRPMFNKLKGDNLFIFGPPGVGKTLCVRHVLREVEKSSNILTAYVNCWVKRTRPAILYEITKSIGNFAPRRGVSTDEIIETLNHAVEHSWGLVIALDEIDRTDDKDVLYDLLRSIKTNVMIIGLSNRTTFETDDRIISTYSPRRIEFKPYNVDELKNIVMHRAREALVPGSYDDEVIGLCAAVGYRAGGDARIALNLLLRSAIEAVRLGKDRITVDIVEKVKNSMVIRDKHCEQLDGLEKRIYDMLDRNNGMSSADLYKMFPEVTERTIRNILNRLIEKNMVKRIKITAPGRGKKYKYVRV